MTNLLPQYSYPLVTALEDMERRLDQFFPFNQWLGRNIDHWLPHLDVKDEGERYLVRIDLPGVNKQGIKVRVAQNNHLIIEGERESQVKKERKDYLCLERSQGAFYRKIMFPSGINSQGIKANYHAGVLEIVVPKVHDEIVKEVAIET